MPFQVGPLLRAELIHPHHNRAPGQKRIVAHQVIPIPSVIRIDEDHIGGELFNVGRGPSERPDKPFHLVGAERQLDAQGKQRRGQKNPAESCRPAQGPQVESPAHGQQHQVAQGAVTIPAAPAVAVVAVEEKVEAV